MTDILFDSGASRTMVRLDLVPQVKMVEGEVLIKYAHGDRVKYPLADVCIEVGGKRIVVGVAVARRLPVSAILGRDVPDKLQLLKGVELAMTTRAQAQAEAQVKARVEEQERRSGPVPNPIDADELQGTTAIISRMPLTDYTPPEEMVWGREIDEDLFKTSQERVKHRRHEHHAAWRERTQSDTPRSQESQWTREELQGWQKEDESLEQVRREVRDPCSLLGSGFYME